MVAASAAQSSTRPRLAPTPWTSVQFGDLFWAPRLRLIRERTLPALHRQLRTSGRLAALRLGWRKGMRPVPHPFWDSDVAKWLEGASYSLATHPDSGLGNAVEEAIALFQGAQQPDGYLNSYVTSVEPEQRWTDLRDGHELYCAGHLIEAGVAHFLATGQRSLLDVVARYADYIASVFGTQTGQKRGYCGHPEIELALVRLFRATGEARYLQLSKYFVDERGGEPYYFDLEGAERSAPRGSDGYYRRHGLRGLALRRYNQSHAPVREQAEVVGHAVRAMYLFSAMADLAGETHDAQLLSACERLWSHLVGTRLYVTGGIGSSEHNEGFTADYDLPNDTAYAESCAAIGLIGWAQRMFHLTCDGRYTDVLERVLYNAIAAAIGSDGKHFFYANPLASQGEAHRQPWFAVACCPPNIARLLASLGQYVYSTGEHDLAVHLYVRGSSTLSVGGQAVVVRQEHDYPWDGSLRLDLELPHPSTFTLWLRLPGWSRGAALQVNGERIDVPAVLERGYVRLERTWCAGDRIELELPMPVDRVTAHPAVAHDIGHVALQRGPIVYCLEQVDNPLPLHTLMLSRSAQLTARLDRAYLGGIVAVHADAIAADTSTWNGQLYQTQPPPLRRHPLVAVPYAVWDNRSAGQMQVWIREAGVDDPL